MRVANLAHSVNPLLSVVFCRGTNTDRKLVSLVTCPFSLPRGAKSIVFKYLTEGHGSLRRLLLYTGMIVYDPPTHREPMKNERKNSSRVPNGAVQLPTTEDQSGFRS